MNTCPPGSMPYVGYDPATGETIQMCQPAGAQLSLQYGFNLSYSNVVATLALGIATFLLLTR